MDMEISGTWSSESKVHILALSDDTTPAKKSASHDLGSAKNPMDFVKRKKVVPQFGIAKLVHITPIKPMVYGRYNELVNGVYKPTYNWGGTILQETLGKNTQKYQVLLQMSTPNDWNAWIFANLRMSL